MCRSRYFIYSDEVKQAAVIRICVTNTSPRLSLSTVPATCSMPVNATQTPATKAIKSDPIALTLSLCIIYPSAVSVRMDYQPLIRRTRESGRYRAYLFACCNADDELRSEFREKTRVKFWIQRENKHLALLSVSTISYIGLFHALYIVHLFVNPALLHIKYSEVRFCKCSNAFKIFLPQ